MDVKCFDILKEMIEDVTKMFSPEMVCSEKKVDTMRKICNAIDKFAKTHETTFYDISIDDSTYEIVISVDCDGFILDEPDDKMYAVIGCARNFTVEQGDKEDIIIFTLTFPGVWNVA